MWKAGLLCKHQHRGAQEGAARLKAGPVPQDPCINGAPACRGPGESQEPAEPDQSWGGAGGAAAVRTEVHKCVLNPGQAPAPLK